MKKHGVMAGSVEVKTVFQEDKEKMQEYQEKLAFEAEEAKRKAEEQIAMIANQAELSKEEKEKMTNEIRA